MHEVLNSQPVKPHKMRYYLQRRDPAFEERKAVVLEVYAAAEMLRQMPAGRRPVAVLSYDEKPGIQAIATTAPDLRPKPGKPCLGQRDHEYKRLGTATLSATVDLVSGFVHHAVTAASLARVLAFPEPRCAYPPRLAICLLLGNHSAHAPRDQTLPCPSPPSSTGFHPDPRVVARLTTVNATASARIVLRTADV